jgi:hypothetical protein
MNPLRQGATGRTKRDVAMVRRLYLDCDARFEQVLADVSAAGLTPNFALRTSPDHGQLIWQVEGFSPELAEATMRALVRQFHTDPAATDINRILRIPGFRNWKYSDGPLVTAEKLTDRVYTPADFPTLYPACGFGALPQPCSQSPKRRGDQSARDFAYACRHLKLGEDPTAIASKIAEYRGGDKANPADYARRTLEAAQREISN